MKIRFSSPENRDPARAGQMQVRYAPEKRLFARWRWYLIVLITASPLLFYLARLLLSLLLITAPGRILYVQADVASPIAGVLERLLVEPGATVTAGQVLAVLREPRLEERLQLLRAEGELLAREQARTADVRDEELVLARLAVERQQLQLERYRRLLARGAATRAELQVEEGRLQEQLAAAARLEAVRRQQAAGGIEQRLAQVRQEIEAVERTIAELQPLAPLSGRVLGVTAVPGQVVAAGGALLTLGDPAQVAIEVFLEPRHLRHAAPGSRVHLTFPDGSELAAVVTTTPELVRRLPPEFLGSFSDPSQVLVVRVEPLAEVPAQLRVHALPLKASFGTALPGL